MKKSYLNVEIPGLPEAQGSAKAFVVAGKARITSSNTKLTAWRRDAIMSLRAAGKAAGLPHLHGSVELRVYFRFPRPKSHFGSGRNADKLKPSAPYYKTSKPDIDKLERALLDAITGSGLWDDDAQVVAVHKSKVYVLPGEAPGVEVHITAPEWNHLPQASAA